MNLSSYENYFLGDIMSSMKSGEKPGAKDVLGRTIKDLSQSDWWGIPRREIPWYSSHRLQEMRRMRCMLYDV